MSIYDKILKQTEFIETERLILRWFKESDVEDVFEYASDVEVVEFLTWPAHGNIEHTKKRFPDFFIDKPGMFAIELMSEKKCIGCIDIRIDESNDKGSFGYVLNKKYWNRGYTTEALTKILNFSFNDLGLNRVESTHYVGNEQSGKVMEKSGMKYEGLGKDEVKIKGKYMDVMHYGILKRDWK